MKNLALYAHSRMDDTQALIAHHAPLVKRIAYHMLARLPDSVQVDDLIQAGMLGLLEATRRFDATQGANFATFADRRIRGAMVDEIRKGDWVPRSVHRKAREVAAAVRAVETQTGSQARDQDVAGQLGISVAEYHELLADLRGQKLLSIDALGPDDHEEGWTDYLISAEEGPAESAQRDSLIQHLIAAIDTLPERERLVLSLYYDEELNLKEIGEVLGVSESRVSQLHSQALLRLRSRVNG